MYKFIIGGSLAFFAPKFWEVAETYELWFCSKINWYNLSGGDSCEIQWEETLTNVKETAQQFHPVVEYLLSKLLVL